MEYGIIGFIILFTVSWYWDITFDLDKEGRINMWYSIKLGKYIYGRRYWTIWRRNN